MVRSQQFGLKLNPDKRKISTPEVKFYGVICSAEGIKPHPKVSALRNMSAPTNSQELMLFLVLATYMGPFILSLRDLAASLCEVMKKDTHFRWNEDEETAFQKVESAIVESTTFSYFDTTKPITFQVDALMKTLGATLLQEGRPVAYASKALTPAEKRYANIERGMFALVYGCERFRNYVFGHKFSVQSDHKPLAAIHLKHFSAAPRRLR